MSYLLNFLPLSVLEFYKNLINKLLIIIDIKLVIDHHTILPLVPCLPPNIINPRPHDTSTMNLTWVPVSCYDVAVSYALYIYYSKIPKPEEIDQGNQPWHVQGINEINSWALITDLKAATKYKGYLLYGTDIGNGPPSNVFMMDTPVGRKKQKFNILFE